MSKGLAFLFAPIQFKTLNKRAFFWRYEIHLNSCFFSGNYFGYVAHKTEEILLTNMVRISPLSKPEHCQIFLILQENNILKFFLVMEKIMRTKSTFSRIYRQKLLKYSQELKVCLSVWKVSKDEKAFIAPFDGSLFDRLSSENWCVLAKLVWDIASALSGAAMSNWSTTEDISAFS